LDAVKGVDMHEMVIFIQRIINDAFGKEMVKKLTILYGGSVSPANAGEILENGKVDGFLVGRQSLYPDAFSEIIKIVSDAK
jgi:triosephosphate isomerase